MPDTDTDHAIRSARFHALQIKQVASNVIAAYNGALQPRLEDAILLLNRAEPNVGEALLCIREAFAELQKLRRREYRP